ncbi:ATP-binding cassette domain-containing protein [Geodermatophilus sp. YIM 151500]|uniref:ABC transporter ATP-binding protein n=1 Tax=Geodermatophilus sp. YIM 151500 TaxID=2984531 RepID=UPI0021E3809F|nr:ATP-binding cassette domain-containing protein [Geodermatophilus sp. YIM 151500]MCV2491974.1 ATP-binding cassette domain-containing protein [Geodermatophilus sp. YIM 151500]
MSGAHRPRMLVAEGVSKAFGTGTSRTVVLESVDLVVHDEEKVSLVGPSGSGKSTLLSLVAGLGRPDAGRISIGGVATDGLDDAGRAALRAERVGVVLQSDNLIPFLTALENVELAMGFTRRPGRRGRPRELLAALGVDHRRDHLPRRLSGGEAQRVSIAVALANAPALLLADEVVGQLDSATAEHVVDVIFGSELAVLFVTHDESLAARGDRRLRLVDGSLVEW